MSDKPISPTLTRSHAAHLLERFYAGSSTQAEEQMLYAFLCSPQCPPEWIPDREVLASAMQLPEMEVPTTLAANIGSSLRHHIRKQWWQRCIRYSMSAAAVAVVAITALMRPPVTPSVYTDTCLTPREAAVETENTLLYLSDNLNMALSVSDDDLGGPCP